MSENNNITNVEEPTNKEKLDNKLKLEYLLEDIRKLYEKITEFHRISNQLVDDNATLRQDNHNLRQLNLKLERTIFTLRFNGNKEFKMPCGCHVYEITCSNNHEK